MVHPDKIFGKLGNRMFQMAALMQYSRTNNHNIYCQSTKYFDSIQDEITHLYRQGIGDTIDYVSIHVRRGDYLNEPQFSFHGVLGMEYYLKAMAHFPDDKFMVFSDDMAWCKDNFLGQQYTFTHGTELEDMNLMASCKSNIIANSSFSWWAAYLNKNPSKKIIAPKRWFADGSSIGIPNKWLRI